MKKKKKISQKEILEIKKLELEIQVLNKPWYTKPAYIGILIALISVLSAQLSGIFDVKKEQLELSKIKLELDIAKFEIQKSKLSKGIASLNSIILEKDSLLTQITTEYLSLEITNHKLLRAKTKTIENLKRLKKQKEHLTSLKSNLEKNIKTKEGQLKNSYAQINKLETENSSLKKALLKLEPTQYKEVEFKQITTSNSESTVELQIGYKRDNLYADKKYLNSVVNIFMETIGHLYNTSNIIIDISGNADRLAISPYIQYKGEYGDVIQEEYYYSNSDTFKTITIKIGDYIKSNEELAFIRAYGLKYTLKENLWLKNKSKINLKINTHNNVGAKYRNINLKITQQKNYQFKSQLDSLIKKVKE